MGNISSPVIFRTAKPCLASAPSAAKRKMTEILALADVRVDGNRPWDIHVRDERLYQRCLSYGTLGVGEAYMDGWWEADALDELVVRVHHADLPSKIAGPSLLWLALKGRVLNRQSLLKSKEVAGAHYDIGNDVYEAMLDRRMQYTCAYWKSASTLDEAQEDKLHLICRKLKLSPGMSVLELGSGFGGLAYFMAKEYGCDVVSYNISHEQVRYSRALCDGLSVRVEEKDYREAAAEAVEFDRIVSVGLCEHIGYKNYAHFFAMCHGLLKPGGLLLLHTIGGNASYTSTDPWIDRYIFPNGMIPSIAQLGKAFEHEFIVEDWHNFGPDYDRTLLAWWKKFDAAWPHLRQKYGDRFYRMWKFYLLSSAGSFRSRRLQLWQLVLSKGDISSYAPVR